MALLLKLLFAVSSCFAQSFSDSTPTLLVIPVKTPHDLNITKDTPIYIKDRILKVRVQNGRTYLVGQKEGLTLIKIANQSYTVKVSNSLEWQAHLAFIKTFKDHPNLKLEYSDTDTLVSGDVLLQNDFVELLNWLETYSVKPKFNLNFATPEFKKEFMAMVSEKLSIPVLDFDSNMHLKLSRNVDKPDLEKVNNLGFELKPENSNGSELGVLDIQFINVSDSEIKKATSILPTSFQWSLDEKIKLLAQVIDSDYSKLNSINNKSSLINLMLFENEKTEYHSGGEFAIQQRSIYRNDVQWKTYGLFVDVLPVSISADEVQLQLKFKISYVTSSDLTQPSLSQDSWTQKFRIKRNKSLIVSNSFTNLFSKDKSNHLFLESIPVLSALFKGKNSNKESTNVYMVIKMNTPNIEITNQKTFSTSSL